MINRNFFLVAMLFASVSVNAAPVAESTESDTKVILWMLIILIAIFLFAMVRFWRATNDISALKAKICNKGLAEKSIMRSEVMRLHMLNKDEEAFEILNDALYDEARKLYRATNDGKDYKEMVFLPTEDGSKKLSCQDFFDHKWKQTLEKFALLYEEIGHQVPEGLKNVGYDYIKNFGQQ